MARLWPEDQRFADRREAGRRLAERLNRFAGRPDVVVLALPRGGVPVGYEVAQALGVPLDVMVVRKLGFPGNAEFAMGAIGSGGVRVLNEEIPPEHMPPAAVVEAITGAERRELERREEAYRGRRTPVPVEGRVVLLVDDGLATGTTMRAAVRAVRDLKAALVVVAVPVGAAQAREALAGLADEVICLRAPEPFTAVGLWYRDFPQTSDEEVVSLLTAASAGR